MTFSPLAPRAQRAEFEQWRRQRDLQERHQRERKLSPLPYAMRADALAAWEGAGRSCEATRALNLFAADAGGLLTAIRAAAPDRNADRIEQRDTLHRYSSDASVKAWANRRAGQAQALARHYVDEGERFGALATYTEGFGIRRARPLKATDPVYLTGAVRRMQSAKWWRRRARRALTLRIEGEEIAAGHVHRRAGLYVSDVNVTRGIQAIERNQQTLLELEAVNDMGDRVNLADMAAKSLANPKLRFAELMTRIKGLESVADELGLSGLFVTWTLPSAYHPRLSGSGAGNDKWMGATPRDGQNYLTRQWAKVRATLKRAAVEYFGLRVAEPHHDGTPHWHLLIWCARSAIKVVVRELRKFALQQDGDEQGAKKIRLKVEGIRKDKGGASSYLVKYVSKLTCADGIEQAKERGADGVQRDLGDAKQAALRARLWAATNGIRQFQFFGTPAIGVWREFRRLREPLAADQCPEWGPAQRDLFEQARVTADSGNYGAHVRACGGIGGRRFVIQRHEGEAGANVYGEPAPARPLGIRFQSGRACAVTRPHVWTIEPKGKSGAAGASVAPWTRGNNCNGADWREGVDGGKHEYRGSGLSPLHEGGGCAPLQDRQRQALLQLRNLRNHPPGDAGGPGLDS